jgi:DNA-binding phage protein
MKREKSSMQTETCGVEQGRSVLNFLAELADDPIEQLKKRRARVAAQLSALLATLNLSHSKVADKAHMKRSQLSRQLSGDANLTIDTIARICEAAGADFDVVFRMKAAPAAKQFWEVDDTAQIKIVEALNFEDAFSMAERLFRAHWDATEWVTPPANAHLWRVPVRKESKDVYQLEVSDINGHAGCISASVADAANENKDYDSPQSIAA